MTSRDQQAQALVGVAMTALGGSAVTCTILWISSASHRGAKDSLIAIVALTTLISATVVLARGTSRR